MSHGDRKVDSFSAHVPGPDCAGVGNNPSMTDFCAFSPATIAGKKIIFQIHAYIHGAVRTTDWMAELRSTQSCL
jgi:hypothetical protein